MTRPTIRTADGTGFPGITRASSLPVGWVSVSEWSPVDRWADYTGPLLEETDTLIRVEVWEASMTFYKSGRLTISRPEPQSSGRAES